MNERIKLSEAMGWRQIHDSPGHWYPPGLPPLANAFGHTLPDPFTDANDERAVFRYVMEQRFSTRQAFWRELRKIILADKLANVAWPDVLMFAKDGDMARAALKVIE